jgi:hypothetical protein
MPEYEVRNDILQTTARALYEFCPALLERVGLQDVARERPEDATSKIKLSEADVEEIIVELHSVETMFGKGMIFERLPIGNATVAWRTLIANCGASVISMNPYSVFADAMFPVELIVSAVTVLAVVIFGIYVDRRNEFFESTMQAASSK